MKVWVWKPEKNEKLVENERPSFEKVLAAIREGGIRDIQTNANLPKTIFVDCVRGQVCSRCSDQSRRKCYLDVYSLSFSKISKAVRRTEKMKKSKKSFELQPKKNNWNQRSKKGSGVLSLEKR